MENDTGFAIKFIFRLGKTLEGNDLAEKFGGGILVGVEKTLAFVEFGGKSGSGIVLGSGFWQIGEIFGEPIGASGGEFFVDNSFVEGETFKRGLMVNWASVHSFDEFHNGIAKISVASKNGRFDR